MYKVHKAPPFSPAYRSVLCCLGYTFVILQFTAGLGLLFPLLAPYLNWDVPRQVVIGAISCLCLASIAPCVLRPVLREYIPFYTTIVWIVWNILIVMHICLFEIDVYPEVISHLAKTSTIMLFSVASMHLYYFILRLIRVDPEEDPVFFGLHSAMFSNHLERNDLRKSVDLKMEEGDFECPEAFYQEKRKYKHKFVPSLERISSWEEFV